MKQFVKFPRKLALTPMLSPIEKATLLAALSFNPSHPTIAQLSKLTGLSYKTTQRNLRALKQKSILTWTSGKKTNAPNRYSLQPENQWNLGINSRQNPTSKDLAEQEKEYFNLNIEGLSTIFHDKIST
jgi:DNA-binding IclR family transcriptional regulator